MQKIETIDQPRGEAAAVGQFDMFRRECRTKFLQVSNSTWFDPSCEKQTGACKKREISLHGSMG